MTEAEAKTKWCPFARDAQEGIGPYNRIGGNFAQDRNANGVLLFKDLEGNIGTRAEVGIKSAPVGHTAPVLGAETCLCLGSACMAWIAHVVRADEGRCGLVPLASK